MTLSNRSSLSLRIIGAAFMALLAIAPAFSQLPQISLELLQNGFSRPLLVTHAGDGSGRLFVVEQRGRIRIIDATGTLLATDFLNLGSTGLNRVSQTGNERGLLGLAFHPNYELNGRFFVSYTQATGGDSILAEYAVSANPDIAEATERVLVGPIDQPFSNHNGGHILFGPDGYLYYGLGDGGDGGDPGNRAQNLTTLLGKMLRIDVSSTTQTYTIPPTNPFAGAGPELDEIYAYGLRNPWRFSIDFLTGRLFCGDVGQGSFEEVSLIESGDNMGWKIMEGFDCFSPSTGCDMTGLKLPLTDYGRSLGVSVTGGFVYRGSQYPNLYGKYLFGDFGSGRIWMLEETAPDVWVRTQLLDTTYSISSFGEDEQMEMYVVHHGGEIYRLIDTVPAPTPTPTPVPIDPTRVEEWPLYR